MSKTINFCGASHLYFDPAEDVSWCAKLANALGAKVIGTGWGESAYEYAIKSFNPEADITVFGWVESMRLYHKNYTCTYRNGVRYMKSYKEHELMTLMSEMFYRTFYTKEYFNEIQRRQLYWFDHEILSQYKGIIVHCYRNEITHQFKHGIVSPIMLRDLSSATRTPDTWAHMDKETNEKQFHHIYQLLKDNYDL